MSTQLQRTYGNGITVRDVIVAKAIQNGYNPFCRSTDANARKVTEEMRVSAQRVYVPSNTSVVKREENKSSIREAKAVKREQVAKARREVVSLENFQVVNRRTHGVSVAMLVSVIISALVLSMVVYSGSLVNEKTRECAVMSRSISDLESENAALALELAEKNDLAVIEDIAKNDFGMIKVAEAEQRYVSLENENTVSTFSAEGEDNAVTMHLLNVFGTKINDILEYLD